MFWQYLTAIVVLPLLIMGFLIFVTFVMVPCAFIFASWYMRIYKRKLQRRKRDGANVAFFHPYCNGGGGGERVLWAAIKAVLIRFPDVTVHIYTVETEEPKKIFDKVQNTFNIIVDRDKIQFIRLSNKALIDPKTYPYFTLLLQSLGSMVLGMEAFMKLNPDIYIDTMGVAFTYPIFHYLAQCPVISYTHYPIITAAMTKRVMRRVATHNNSRLIAGNPVLTYLKIFYYKFFGLLYRLVGRCATLVLSNGTWTQEHLRTLWGGDVQRVYPPCEVSELKKLKSLVRETDPIKIISVAQFRPEKDHPLMLQTMYELRNLLVKNECLWDRIQLVLIGSCRGEADRALLAQLKNLAKHLSLEKSVKFDSDVTHTALLNHYQTATIALHAMWNEHFGISVVECMAAGLVTVAHRSGGPLADIITPSGPARNGLLAEEPSDYARALLEVIAMDDSERKQIVETARASVDRFSTSEFEKAFIRSIEPFMSVE